WGPRAIGDHGAPVSLPKLKKAYEKAGAVNLNIKAHCLLSDNSSAYRQSERSA
ncbi:unnamed protein product, partial [Staurois parvus]